MLGVAGAALLLSALPASAQDVRVSALENDLSLVETEVVALERRIQQMRGELSSGALTRSDRLTTERFNEARYAYLVEDYERCALLFFSLLENKDLKTDSRLPEAQWYLGECLYLDGNLIPAQDQFRTIVDMGATHPFYGESLLSLIEIYGRTGELQQFNYYYNNFVSSAQQNNATSLRIRYQMAKTLYRQGKFAEAQAIFRNFPRGSTYTPQARYFSAAIVVAEGLKDIMDGDQLAGTQKYQQAISGLTEVLTLPVSTPEHRDVMDLTHLAIGRLQYELGDIPAAIAEYTAVSSESAFYDDALYELIWANIEAATQEPVDFVRARKLQEALRAVEIFNLAFPGDVRESKLRLLGAQVQQKMEQWDLAIEEFENASGHFEDLATSLAAIVSSGADPMVYFNQLVDDQRYVAEAELTVPPAARLMARDDERVADAVVVSGDLYKQQDALEDAVGLLEVLEEALYGSETIGIIQTYRMQRQQLSSAVAAALLLRSRLVDIEMLYLEGAVDGGAKKDLVRIRDSREESEGKASGLTRMRNSSVERQQAFNMQAQAVEGRVYHVEIAVSDLLAQVSAIEEYLLGARKRGERTREEESSIRSELEVERASLTELRSQLAALKRRLEPRILTARLVNESTAGEELMRGDASQELMALERRLARLRRNISSDRSNFLTRLNATRSRLLELERIAEDARNLMDRAEAVEVDEIKAEVEFQRRMVVNLQKEGSGIATENQEVSGRIGRHAFKRVADFYQDMLARADMGIIDVYWYRKESTSQSKREMARDKNRQLRALEATFSGVVEEDN
ncbi:MAG: hypothetical protein CMP23_13760 [Rickettsiales bacterium]|nr:hypothetical protein [Rickettsiales bacterium]